MLFPTTPQSNFLHLLYPSHPISYTSTFLLIPFPTPQIYFSSYFFAPLLSFSSYFLNLHNSSYLFSYSFLSYFLHLTCHFYPFPYALPILLIIFPTLLPSFSYFFLLLPYPSYPLVYISPVIFILFRTPPLHFSFYYSGKSVSWHVLFPTLLPSFSSFLLHLPYPSYPISYTSTLLLTLFHTTPFPFYFELSLPPDSKYTYTLKKIPLVRVSHPAILSIEVCFLSSFSPDLIPILFLVGTIS